MYEYQRKKVKYYTHIRPILDTQVFSELSTRRWESILKTTGMVMGEL